MTRRAVVTGGAGFVGAHLCEALAARGWEVVSMDDYSTGRRSGAGGGRETGVETWELDITGPGLQSAMTRAGPDVVFHLAAVSSVTLCENDQGRCAEVNVEGTARVLEAAAGSGASRLVNVSSLAVHGIPDGGTGPAYGLSKRAAEDLVSRRAPAAGVGWVTLRPANVYGPRQCGDGESAVVAAWLAAMAGGGPLYLDGDGRQTRDFLYVADAVAAMIAAADRADGLTLELGSGVETSLLELLGTMRDVTGRRGRVDRRPARSGDIRRSVVDPRPARAALGWSAGTGLESGLRATWDWLTSR